MPKHVVELKQAIAEADALLLASPEYNHSLPGTLKNAIDWLSLPREDIGKTFGGKAVAVMSASRGPLGGCLAQMAWLPVFRALHLQPFYGDRPLLVPFAQRAFDADGNVTQPDLNRRLARFMQGFAAFVAALPGREAAQCWIVVEPHEQAMRVPALAGELAL